MSTPDTLTAARKLLRPSGRRTTPQRAFLLELIKEQGGHLDADEIYRLASERGMRISLSTVYRTLAVLRDLGVVDELHLDEGHHHYEVRSSTEHHHIICLGCNAVVEFESPLVESMKETVSQEHHFRIRDARVDLTGYCSDCCDRLELDQTAQGATERYDLSPPA